MRILFLHILFYEGKGYALTMTYLAVRRQNLEKSSHRLWLPNSVKLVGNAVVHPAKREQTEATARQQAHFARRTDLRGYLAGTMQSETMQDTTGARRTQRKQLSPPLVSEPCLVVGPRIIASLWLCVFRVSVVYSVSALLHRSV